MISGATYTLPLNIRYPLQNTEKIIITLKNEATGIKRTKHYPNNEETWMMADGRIGVRLTQQDTIDLVGYVKIEAQINLKSGAVAKTKTERTYIASTLNTEIVEGAADNGENLLDGVTLELGAPITAEGEGTSFQPGNALELKDGILNVLTTDDAEKGNNLPITSEGARKFADNISYNDLKDRPFYEETKVVNEPLNITWDGNTEGRVVIDEEGNGEVLICKVSDLILTDEQIKKCWVTILADSSTDTLPVEGDLWEIAVANGYVTEHVTAVQTVFFVRTAGAELFGVTYPEAGIYFTSYPNEKQYTHDIYSEEPIEQTNTVVHKLDKKYLPDDVGGGNALVVTVILRYDYSADELIATADKTKNEIKEAIEKGTPITCFIYEDDDGLYLCDVFRDVSLDGDNVVIHGLSGAGNEVLKSCYRSGYKFTDDGVEYLDETWFKMDRLYIANRFHITSNNGTLWSVEVDDDGNLQVDKVSVPK